MTTTLADVDLYKGVKVLYDAQNQIKPAVS